jgi:hypothetical protein
MELTNAHRVGGLPSTECTKAPDAYSPGNVSEIGGHFGSLVREAVHSKFLRPQIFSEQR